MKELLDLNKMLLEKGLAKEANHVQNLFTKFAKKGDMSEFSKDDNLMTALNFGQILSAAAKLQHEMDAKGNLSKSAYKLLGEMKTRIEAILATKKS